jgi:hypothetical protein
MNGNIVVLYFAVNCEHSIGSIELTSYILHGL